MTNKTDTLSFQEQLKKAPDTKTLLSDLRRMMDQFGGRVEEIMGALINISWVEGTASEKILTDTLEKHEKILSQNPEACELAFRTVTNVNLENLKLDGKHRRFLHGDIEGIMEDSHNKDIQNILEFWEVDDNGDIHLTA